MPDALLDMLKEPAKLGGADDKGAGGKKDGKDPKDPKDPKDAKEGDAKDGDKKDAKKEGEKTPAEKAKDVRDAPLAVLVELKRSTGSGREGEG